MHKVVRFQDSGAEVEKLQLALKELGFSPGPVDGKFGFLTEEALLAFQRMYSLKPDGLAGREVWQLLAQRGLPILQFPHPLSEGQSLMRVDAEYQLAAGTVRAVNRVGKRYPGQLIYIPQRKVLALWDPQAEPEGEFSQQDLSCVGIYGWRLGENLVWTGEEELAMVVRRTGKRCLAIAKLEDWDFLSKKKTWAKRIAAIRLSLVRGGLAGLFLELQPGAGKRRRRLAEFLKKLAAELASQGRLLYLKLPARKKEDPTNDSDWSLDFRALGAAASAVVLDFSVGQKGSFFLKWLDDALHYAKGAIPAWKILPLCGETYSAGQTRQLLSVREKDRVAKIVLHQRLGGIAFELGKGPDKRYFVTECRA